MSLVKLARQRFRIFAMTKPWLFFPLYGLFEKNKRLFVNNETEIVIEGFPRSGNTFSVVAFERAQKRSVSVAHHLHVAAQVMRGVERGLPVLVLLRNPDDAVLSYYIRHPHLNLTDCYREYVVFYNAVLPLRDKVVLGFFEDVISDYGKVIKAVNEKFGTDFGIFEHDEVGKEGVFEVIKGFNAAKGRSPDQIAIPTASKDARKAEVRAAAQAQVSEALRSEARRLYETLRSGSRAS